MLYWLLTILIPSLLIAEPDYDHFYSTYGHAAIRVQCPELGTDFVFNQVGQQIGHRVLHYAMGDLKMGMQVMEMERYLQTERGTMVEYPLLLSDSMTLALCSVLEHERARGYADAYDPLTGGCCQVMIRYMNEAAAIMHQPIAYRWSEEYALSIRELNSLHSRQNPWTAVLLNMMSGTKADRRGIGRLKKVNYPDQLVEVWTASGLLGEGTVLKTEDPGKPFPIPPLAVAIVLAVLCVLSWVPCLHRGINYCLLTVIELVGIMVLLVSVGSTYSLAGWNWLLVVFNPLMAVAWHWRRYWALPYAGVLAVLLGWTLLSEQMVMLPCFQVVTAGMMVWLIKNQNTNLKKTRT